MVLPLTTAHQRHVRGVVSLIGHVHLTQVQVLVVARHEGVLTEQFSVVTEKCKFLELKLLQLIF